MKVERAEMGQPMSVEGLRWLKLNKYQSVLIARARLGEGEGRKTAKDESDTQQSKAKQSKAESSEARGRE
jgi:hypothetical protein